MPTYRRLEVRTPNDPAVLVAAASLSGLTNNSWYDGTGSPVLVPDGAEWLMIEWDLVYASAPTDFKGLLGYVLWDHRPSGQTSRFASGGTGASYLPIGTPISMLARASTNLQRDSLLLPIEGRDFVFSCQNIGGAALATGTSSVVRYQFINYDFSDAAR